MNGLRNESLLKAVKGYSNHPMIESISLKGDQPSDYLVDLAKRFKPCSTQLEIVYFYETKQSVDKRVCCSSSVVELTLVNVPTYLGRY